VLTFDRGLAWIPPVVVAIAITGAAVLLATGNFLPRWLRDAAATAVAAAVTALAAVLLAQSAHGPVVTWVARWVPVRGFSVGIVMQVDPVGAGLALIAASLTTLALLYSWRYLESMGGHYHALLLLFLAGMEGLALTGDVFDMFVFFELMGVAAYALTGMKVEDPTSVQGAFNFGIINSLGAYLSLTGVGLLYAQTGNLGLPQISEALAGRPLNALVVAAFVLVLTGFLVKAAVAPFHFWLADAHAVAPAPVCVLFSGIMVPLGLYAAWRVYWVGFSRVLPGGDVQRAFLVMGLLTAAVGAVMCVGQRHIKRLLAYSTIAHVGLFLCALAMLSQTGTAGAVVYVAGHSGAKAALFLMAGLMLNRFGSVDEHELYGRIRGSWLMAVLWGLGAVALAGLPPFGTGLGKAMAEEAGLHGGYPYLPVVFVLVSALTGGAVLRVGARVFLGWGPSPSAGSSGPESTGEEKPEAHLRRIPVTMLLPIVILLLGSLLCGLLPSVRAGAEHAAAYFTDPVSYTRAALDRAATPVTAPRKPNWTGLGLGLGFASVAAAVMVAAMGLYSRALAERAGVVAALGSRVLAALRRLHSGHIGDYASWLMTGVAALAALVGIPLAR